MKIVLATALLFLFSIAGVAQTASEQTKIAAEIRAVMDIQAADWNRGDIDSFMRGYWRSDKLVFVSGGNIARGWQQTIDRYKRNYDTRAKMGTLTFSDLEITVLSRDAAFVLGSWSLAREKDNPHGKFTLVFRKIGGAWRIVMDHTS
jgi:ketosteroid isomerase-like protein